MNNPAKVGQPVKNCLHGEKSSHLSEISLALTSDLSWVGWIHSHINDLLLQSEIHYYADISLRWDVSPGWDEYSHINRSLELLLFIDSLRTETAISFLITDFNNNIFVCRSSHFIMCFKKTCLKVSVYPRSSLLEILHPDHEFLRNVT